MVLQRLDKVIASTGRWSRREVKELVRQGRVTVNGAVAKIAEEKADPEAADICVNGEHLIWRQYTWVMLNKPRMAGAKQCWTCCRRSCKSRGYSRWGGWTRTRRACCC